MKKQHPLKQIVALQKKKIPVGICSVCSANEMVIEAAMKRSLELDTPLLVEATANQVNQYGGYTGMNPIDFKRFVEALAERVGFDFNNIILGGDHLGPLTWRNMEARVAMDKAEALVRSYIFAGFTKIHIDTSMKLGDDKDIVPETEVIAQRGARLMAACEEAFNVYKSIYPDAVSPVYVIGSEVPFPGGAQEDEGIHVTTAEDMNETLIAFKNAMSDYQIEELWDDVVAIVVQPGVEFGSDYIYEYDRPKAENLVSALDEHDTIVFEGHSTDYQTQAKLREMVEDGVAILKVGPALSFALRECLYALASIENELLDDTQRKKSMLVEVVEETMLSRPHDWEHHYHGESMGIRLERKYSYFDRARYYLGNKAVREAIETMMDNLRDYKIPLSILSQYLPIQYSKIRKGYLLNDPYEIALDSVVNVLDDYNYAVYAHKIEGIEVKRRFYV